MIKNDIIEAIEEGNEKILEIPNTMPYYKDVESIPSHFGPFGGRYIPETLMQAHEELEQIYVTASQVSFICISIVVPNLFIIFDYRIQNFKKN